MCCLTVSMEIRNWPLPVCKLFYLTTTLAFATFVSAQGVIQAVAGGQYGPDGPWNSVRVWLGSDYQQVDLYPGTFGASYVYTAGFCGANDSSNCPNAEAGLYNHSSSTLSQNPSYPIYNEAPEFGLVFADSLSLSPRSSENNYTVDGELLFVLQENWITPSSSLGLSRNQTVGTLDVGKPDIDRNSSYVNSTALFFREQGLTSSASFGLHLGSAQQNIPISLTFGGYDPARVAGEVISNHPLSGNFDAEIFSISIQDISIVTTEGMSPIGGDVAGLLAGTNSTLQGSTLAVIPNVDTPYIRLPEDTIDGIVELLPVSYNKEAESYLWDIEDPTYKALITSPTFLQFTFKTPSQQVSINVPFALLDLTLTPSSPSVNNATQYLPLQSDVCCGDQELGNYYLGRAFLQAAWLGANWSPEDPNKSVWWLAQAPGPNFPSSKQLEPISNDQFEVFYSNQIHWADTWSAVLKPISSSGGSSSSSGGLSKGAKIGIGVGVGVGGLAVLLLAGWLLYMRQQKNNKNKTAMPSPGPRKYRELHSDTLTADGSSQWQSHIAEVKGSMPGLGEIHEMAVYEVRSELAS